jgi:hypothetical protein
MNGWITDPKTIDSRITINILGIQNERWFLHSIYKFCSMKDTVEHLKSCRFSIAPPTIQCWHFIIINIIGMNEYTTNRAGTTIQILQSQTKIYLILFRMIAS